MAGVASPLLKESKVLGLRFILGYTVGTAIATLLWLLVLLVAGEAASLIPNNVAAGVAWVSVALLGALDLLNRTPQVGRQTPQLLMNTVSDHGWRGLLYGFDIGLLFTTQKTSSLLWMVLVASLLLRPDLIFVVMISYQMAVVSGTVAGAVAGYATRWSSKAIAHGRTGVRIATGAVGVIGIVPPLVA